MCSCYCFVSYHFFSLLSRPGFSNLRWRDWLLLFSASLPLCLQTATTSSLVFVISFILYFYIRPLYLFNIWFSGLVRLTCVVFRPMAFPSVHSNKAHFCIFIFLHGCIFWYLRNRDVLNDQFGILAKRCNEKLRRSTCRCAQSG